MEAEEATDIEEYNKRGKKGLIVIYS